ncbi:GTPase HflX [Periweissella beninensis]|uniref:GTPase HflX n=1 Tax=Periweissella beninensis TaxID=504936 RepID=UPI0021A41E37|nr:GTPase HflX [Periweissella beninensis]MCT4396152.1 GTPase HflX [Periweissella beninensis]
METNIQNVILAGLDDGAKRFAYSMEELANLVAANNMTVSAQMTQKLDHPNPATYFGKGKIAELKELVTIHDSHMIVTNDELSPSQIRNIEAETEVKVLDRTGLILDIFASRAQSRAAKLQVEIARLQYQLPRLRTSMNIRLDQQTGAGGGSFTNRGAGETKLELDRRTIEKQIAHLKEELATIEKADTTRRNQRVKAGLPTVALVGYTNSGKSTTMNGLVRLFGQHLDKQVFEKDMLFATLDTSVRVLTLPDQKQFLLSDTVGFVSKLPHNLISAFRQTLAEAAQADLLIQVVDYADPNYQDMMQTTEQTLKAIGVTNIPMIVGYNKADKLLDPIAYPTREGDTLVYSARDEASLMALLAIIKEHIFNDYTTVDLLIPFSDGQIITYLNDNAHVIETNYVAEGTQVKVELTLADASKYAKYQLSSTDKR